MSSSSTLEQRAIDLAKRGDFGPDAKRANEELTRLTPENAGAWTRLARCCMEMGLFDEADQALDAALQRFPQNTIARNLQAEVARRRAPQPEPARRVRRPSPRTEDGASRPRSSRGPSTLMAAGLGRQEFTSIAHLSPASVVDAMAPRLEPLLMALNERSFAEKIVEARNRNAQAGNTLFRRNSVHAGDTGHVYAAHYGGRWEPQVTIAFFAGHQWRRDAMGAGLRFDFTADADDPASEAGLERLVTYYERLQRLVAGKWRHLLTDWLRANGGFIQHGGNPPATDLLPADAVSWLVQAPNPRELGSVLVGRWLFPDRSEDMIVLTDATRLTRWIEATFNDLLPLWMDVYRG